MRAEAPGILVGIRVVGAGLVAVLGRMCWRVVVAAG